MSLYITQILHDPATSAVLQQLDYHDKGDAKELLIDLDNFLKKYATTKEVSGTKPCSKDDDADELAEIATAWLDIAKQGNYCWPCLDPRDCPGHLRYDGQDRHLITDLVKDLVCALNRARQSIVHKKYVAIAQVRLITARRGESFLLAPGMENINLCRALSVTLDFSDRILEDSIDTLSERLQALLGQDKVVGVPEIFFPLRCYYDHTKQVEAATRVLLYLKNSGVISEIRGSDEQRLYFAAVLCGILCFHHQLELPTDLTDEMLPDLLMKLTIMNISSKHNKLL